MNVYIDKIKSIATKTKYTKWYCNIINSAFCRGFNRKYIKSTYGYVEMHHIYPKSFNMSYSKDIKNTVFLTAKEHFIVHLCATKMFSGILKQKMVFAFQQLRAKNKFQNKRYINSRFYKHIKETPRSFFRYYKGDLLKYVYKDDTNTQNNLIVDGWSTIMTEEYKKGRVGNMRGKKHSDATREKMSKSGKNKYHGVYREETIKQKKNKEVLIRKNLKISDPIKYQELRRQENYMTGKHHSLETKEKIFEALTGISTKRAYYERILPAIQKDWSICKMAKDPEIKLSYYTIKNIISRYSFDKNE